MIALFIKLAFNKLNFLSGLIVNFRKWKLYYQKKLSHHERVSYTYYRFWQIGNYLVEDSRFHCISVYPSKANLLAW